MVLNRKNVSKFDEDFIKNDDENSDKGYILDVDAEYPKNPVDFHGDLSFSERKKNCNKLFCNIHDKGNYVVHIRILK